MQSIRNRMVSKIMMVSLIALFVWLWVAYHSFAQPSDSPHCEVAPDLSSCRGYLQGPAPKPSAFCCYRLAVAVHSSNPPCLCRALRGGASIAANKDRALSLADACKLQPHALGPCYDGSEITESPTESPKEVSSSSTHSTDDLCPDCETGAIDPNTPIHSPP